MSAINKTEDIPFSYNNLEENEQKNDYVGSKSDGKVEDSANAMELLVQTAILCVPVVIVIGIVIGAILYPQAVKNFLRKIPCLNNCAFLQDKKEEPK